MNKPKTSLHLFCGIGGDALGFASSGFVPTCMDFDSDAVAGARYLLGDAARVIQADLAAMEPAELARLVPECPDVVVMSPPCQGNSGCLPARLAQTAKYQALNSLGARALFLVTTTAEVCWGRLPAFVLVENVPRITTRSAELVAEMKAVLHASGFLTSEGFHDCGELGGLAQKRKRWLLAGRNPARVQARLQLPPSKAHLTIWDVLSTIPAPMGVEGGPMHVMPGISDLNALRLAAIPPGKDWRALPAKLRLLDSDTRHSGYLGVQDGAEPSNTVIGNTKGCNGWGSVADVRVACGPREGSYGVADGARPLPTSVIGAAITQNGPWSWPDPRTQQGGEGFTPTHRLSLGEDGVLELVTLSGARALDLASTSPRADVVIVAPDGSYHRPMTDLELALLQGFPARVRGEWLAIPGSREVRRRGIGNAIPPLTACAIADACLEAIVNTNPLAALLTPSDRDVWVDGQDDEGAERWFGAQPEEAHP